MPVSIPGEEVPGVSGVPGWESSRGRAVAPGRALLIDLARIQKKVKEGALERLADWPGRRRKTVSKSEYARLKKDLEEKERMMAEMVVELAILRKKNDWGFVGEIRGTWLEEEKKAKEQEIVKSRACVMWRISCKRVARWAGCRAESRPGPCQWQARIHRALP